MLINSLYREAYYNDRLAYILVLSLMVSVFLVEVHELWEPETIYNGYYYFVRQTIEPNCSWTAPPFERGGLNWYFVCASYMAFAEPQLLPFLISLSLIPIIFLFTRKYTNNFVGMITALGLALNPTFLIFDTSAAYAQTWALLFIGSLYFYKKNPFVSGTLFMASTLAKAIPIAWGIFFLYDIIKNKRCHFFLVSIFVIILLAGVSFYSIKGGSILYSGFVHIPKGYEISSTLPDIIAGFRWNEIILFAHAPMLVLYFLKQKKWALTETPLDFLAVSWLATITIVMFTNEVMFPYRMIPNIVMFLFASSTLLDGYIKNLINHRH